MNRLNPFRLVDYLVFISLVLLPAHSLPQAPMRSAKFSSSPAELPAGILTVGSSCAYQTLQAAVNAAVSGDTIRVEGKTWTGSDATVNFPDKNLILRGGYDSECVSLLANSRTKLDAAGSDTVFELLVSPPAVQREIQVWNFEITGGHGLAAGGINTGRKTSWYFDNSSIHDNRSSIGGGISVGLDSFLNLHNTVVFSNTATTNGGGIYCQGTYTTTQVSIFGASKIGTYVLVPGIPPHVIGLGNHADGSGGGVYMDNCTLTISENSMLLNNIANLDGGGIFAANNSKVNFQSADLGIIGNDAVDGAGVYLEDSDINSTGGQLSYNTASVNGGGLYATGNSVYGYINSSSCQLGKCIEISNNSAGDSGGGVYLANGASIVSFNILMDSNHADESASAIYATGGAQMQIYSSIIIRGSAPNFVIQLDDTAGDPTIGIGESTIAGNTGSMSAILGVDPGTTFNGDGLIVWGNDGASLVAGGGSSTITCSILQSAYTGFRNQLADPLFINAAAGDYHIQLFSPAVDHCYNGFLSDIDGDTRPHYSTGRFNTPYDAGADEVMSSIVFLPIISKQ
jgi:predicted outer membrane repeat protein